MKEKPKVKPTPIASLPYHELFELPEGTPPEDFQPIAPNDIKISVTRYDPDGPTRAHRKFTGSEIRSLETLHAMFGRGFYELEARRLDGTFYARRNYKIEGDPSKPLNPPTPGAVNGANGAGALPTSPTVPGMQSPAAAMGLPDGSMMGGPMGPFQMMMVMMQNLFGMMMAQQNNSTQLLASILGRQNDGGVAAALSSMTELAKTRLELSAQAGAPSAIPVSPEQEIARMNALIDVAKKLNPGVPTETITSQIKELWPIFQPTLGPILAKIVEAGANAATRHAPPPPPPPMQAQPLPDPAPVG
jgi:hypothetical protein